MKSAAVLVSLAGLLPFAAGVRAHGADWELRMTGKRVGAYVDHANVSALARPAQDPANAVGPAASTYRKPWYEMDLVLNKSSAWDVALVVDDPRARGHASFRIEVLPGEKR